MSIFDFDSVQPYDSVIPDYGEIMSVADFKERVADHSFIDYDGHACPIKDGRMSRQIIKPSKVNLIPGDVTRIIWFNR